MKKIINKYCISLWLQSGLPFFSFISSIMIFIPISDNMQFVYWIIGCSLLFILLLSYLVIYVYQIKSRKVKLRINNTEVNILFGDIFNMQGNKVIAFNEYFDTQVDNVIIAKKSLNGQVIKRGLVNTDKFDEMVKANENLRKASYNQNRKAGKKQKYELGEIQPYEDFFFLAFAHFTENNQAILFSSEYATCLLKMWHQLNIYYAQNVINIPLLGSGITRITDNSSVSNQVLLETMLETLKISKETFKSPSKINIVLFSGEKGEEINKYDLIKIKWVFRR